MPTNAEILARRAAATPRGISVAVPIAVARAENAELWDVEGRRYIDFAGGIAVVNTAGGLRGYDYAGWDWLAEQAGRMDIARR